MILQLGAKLDLFAFKNHVGCADSAHLAAHGAGVAVGRRSALKVRTSLFRVNRVFEHLIPVNLVTGVRHSVVLFSRVRNALCDVRSVSRDTAGDNAFLYVAQIGQPEMLGRGYVTEKISAARSSNCTADCGGDVVVAGSDVGYCSFMFASISFIAM